MQVKNNLPEIFDTFAEARRNGFLKVKDLKDKNIPVVGTFCTFVPEELIMAAGAVPVSLCSMTDETIAEAEKDLPRNLCSLIKSSYGFGKTDKCPYFYFSDLVVGETTCDGKKKMYELMQDFKPVHIMQLPNSCVGEENKEYWKNEIKKFKNKLETLFGVEITDEALKDAIVLRNRQRAALKGIYELGKLDPVPVSGMEIYKTLSGSMFAFDKNQNISDLEKLKTTIIERKDENNHGKKRILLTGCPIGAATEKVINAIEQNGGTVVYFDNCTTAKALELLVDEEKEIYDALTDKYISIGCSCMSPDINRVDAIKKAIEEYKVDGVVDLILTACHTYAIESATIKKLANSCGVSYIAVETDYSQSDTAQLNTRLAAFAEML